ncbi:MAG TPA: hypothetical protein VGB95_00110 [Chitinophagales bacterium]
MTKSALIFGALFLFTLVADMNELPKEIEDIPDFFTDDFSAVKTWLVNEIDYLLHHNMERLQWVLYRIDIDERKLKKLLETDEETLPSEIIANAIIARQIQKYHSRKASGSAEWNFDV